MSLSEQRQPEAEEEPPNKKQRDKNGTPRTGHVGSTGNILSFAYENVTITDSRWTADCLYCVEKRQKSDKKGTTSNFLSHVRQVHPQVYMEYVNGQQQSARRRRPVTKLLDKTAPRKRGDRAKAPAKRELNPEHNIPLTMVTMVPRKAPESALSLRHNFLHDAMVNELLLGDGLPVSCGEGEGFRRFIGCMEPGWAPLSGREIVEGKLPKLESTVKNVIQAHLDATTVLSLTLDCRKRDTFRGVLVGLTGHAVAENFSIRSELLAVKFMPNGVASEELVAFVAGSLADYGLTDKVFYLVNSGSKGTPGSCHSLPGFAAPANEEFLMAGQEIFGCFEDDLTEDDDVNHAESRPPQIGLFSKQLPPFSQTLQLVVRDGLDAASHIEPLVSLLSRLSKVFTAARRNAVKHEDSGLMEQGSTWTAQLKTLRRIFTLETEVNGGLTIVEAVSLKEVKLEAEDLILLHTFVDLMRPFEHATDRAQRGDGHATISTVAPHISGIYRRLLDFYSPASADYERDPCLQLLVETLKESLEMHFRGLLLLLGHQLGHFLPEGPASGSFGDELYLAATFLDPTYKDYWVEEYVPESHRKVVETKMRAAVRHLSTTISSDVPGSSDHSTMGSSSRKRLLPDDCGLDSFRRPKPHQTSNSNIDCELLDYYQDVTSEEELLVYWTLYDKKYPRLAKLVRQLVSVPANQTKFPLRFSDADWSSWEENEAAAGLAFLRAHKSILPVPQAPGNMESVARKRQPRYYPRAAGGVKLEQGEDLYRVVGSM